MLGPVGRTRVRSLALRRGDPSPEGAALNGAVAVNVVIGWDSDGACQRT